MDDRLLGIYLNDHLAGATAGTEISRRTAGSNAGTEYGEALGSIAKEIESDREALREVMRALGVAPNLAKTAFVRLAERTGRVFKLNGRILKYSPLSRVEELELLRIGVEGKLALWTTLKETRAADPRLKGMDFPELARAAERQRDRLEAMRLEAAREAFGTATNPRAKR
ncbi:MAG: hypothetical protein ACRDH9_05310 [Actinomycetota bacterium]